MGVAGGWGWIGARHPTSGLMTKQQPQCSGHRAGSAAKPSALQKSTAGVATPTERA